MKNILNEADYAHLIKRIAILSETDHRRWGKMNIQQMLDHCTRQLKLALGEISHQQQGSAFLRSRLGKWIVFSALPWPKGAETPVEMNTGQSSGPSIEFEIQKKELLNYLEKVKKQKQLMPHPFFGSLSRQEWVRLIYKHVDYHLKQFGHP